MPDMVGTITLVQESRFQVTDEGGVGHLFVLGPHASAEPSQLVPLAARQARVRVRFHTAGRELALVAESVSTDEGSRSQS